MNITITNLPLFIQIVIDLMGKIKEVADKGNPVNVDEELARLEAARLRPSEDIIKEADDAS